MSVASLSRDVYDRGSTFSKTVLSIKKKEPGLCLQVFSVKAEGDLVFALVPGILLPESH